MAFTAIFFDIFGRDKGVKKMLDDVGGEAQKTNTKMGSLAGGLKAAALPAAAIATGAALAAKSLVAAGEAASTADARIANINKQMGLFGAETDAVTEKLIKNAEATAKQTGIDPNVIKQGQAALATFSEVAGSADKLGGIFDRATAASTDLSAAGFGSVESASVMLGKALQDPEKGMTALTRVGVTFTDQQKEQIKAMQEVGDTAGAQEIVMKAVETQVGGTALATANSSDKMQVSWQLATEKLGSALMPALEKVSELVADFSGWVQENSGLVLILGGVITGLAGAVLLANVAMKLYVAGAAIVKGAVLAWTGVQWLLNTALLANPIGIVVLAIAALVASVIWAYNNVGWFKDGVDAAWSGIQTAIGAVVDWFTGTVQPAFDTSLNNIKNFFDDTVKNVGRIWDGLMDIAKKPISFIINTVINDGLIGAFNTVAGWIPGVNKLPPLRIPGFLDGGYTGDGDKREPAGVVHGREFVFTEEETRNAGVSNLQRLARTLRGYAEGGFVNPAPTAAVSSGYGPRAGGFHNGIDLAAALGTPIRAAFGGRVSQAAWSPHGGGNEIHIDHPNGLQTWYAHLSRILVGAGQAVQRGMTVGLMGSTGNSTGSHLHYMVLNGGWPNHMNPGPFMGAGADVPAGGFDPISAIIDGLIGSIRGAFSGGGMLTDIVIGIGRKLAEDMGGALMGGGTGGLRVFDQGGVLDPGTFAVNMSGRPEAVLDPDESKAWKRFVSGGMRVYVQNPFTGEYLLARMADVGDEAIDRANDDLGRSGSV